MPPPIPMSEADPCWKERQLMYKCLDENNYDKDKCEAYVKNGKYCKKFWVNFPSKSFHSRFSSAIADDRKQKMIFPSMPIGEEREKIREECMKNYKKPTIHIKSQ
ncbi:coiled-coil-helix-coiled-coil-helix domain-containing protein 7 isoform X1 [Sitodiplosis mosellana]|uniref:coiled-coil-helix-coiled-coil-helix domain-containing protein 7 isoform X1 n=1 Tax=Sitodiplosis mosellana TaxID=263140 RepID=UPI0024438872|nr:coiled-coil-helix-coiled-coil-helix domain-containing protein 7 isoform X1 [Sitodiplosis mosellana]